MGAEPIPYNLPAPHQPPVKLGAGTPPGWGRRRREAHEAKQQTQHPRLRRLISGLGRLFRNYGLFPGLGNEASSPLGREESRGGLASLKSTTG